MKHLAPLYILLVFCSFQLQSQTLITVYTNYGMFELEMTESLTPITSGNFIDLVNDKYYDGIIFHRVIDNFMIQGGAGPSKPTIPDEFDSTGTLSNTRTTISMANAGPNTGTTQFFINVVNNTHLDYDKAPSTSKHPIFGFVTMGMNVVDSISKVPVDGSNKPLTDARIDSARVTGSTGLQSVGKSTNHLSISPNPVNANSQLHIASLEAGLFHLALFNIDGQLIGTHDLQLNPGGQSFVVLDLFNLSTKGQYLLQLEGDDQKQSIPFLYLGN